MNTLSAISRLSAALLLAGSMCALAFWPVRARASDHRTYCAGMYHCLQETPQGCSAEQCARLDTFDYSAAYCSLFRDLSSRGLPSTSVQGRQIFQQISGKHRVEYALTDKLPMPGAVMVYLMNNLPFSAQMVNAYQGTAFEASYLDTTRRRFSATSENISGVFSTVLRNEPQTSSLYYGYGTVDILAWRLSGTALILLDFEETGPQEITYTVRCLVFPHSVFIKSILNFSLFRRAVIGVLDRTFRAIQNSAMAFDRGEREPIARYPAFATPEGQQQLEAFQRVLHNTMPAHAVPEDPAAQPETASRLNAD